MTGQDVNSCSFALQIQLIMKQFLFAVFFCFTSAFVFAGNIQTPPSNAGSSEASQFRTAFTIDMFDTVVFDISQSVMAGNQVSFPVYFLSDDTINALDFSLVFDETNFSLDTIINLTTYLQPVYNINMGILYFTSYSLQEIDHNTPLVSIRFNMLGHYLCSDDLNSIIVYLNGDPCSVKVIECISDKTPEISNVNEVVSVYPNPVNGILNIVSPEDASVELLDVNGSQILSSFADANHSLQLNTSGIAAGVYTVKISNDHFISFKKIVVN